MTQLALSVINQPTTDVARVQFKSRRATAYGIEYTTADEQVTTVNGSSSTCSCGMEKFSVVCVHRIAALSQEKAYEQEAKARAAYCVTFDIY